MKKVLLVSYNSAPADSMGALRISKFLKYLPEYGYQPYILGGGMCDYDNPYILKPRYFDPYQFGKKCGNLGRRYFRSRFSSCDGYVNIERVIARSSRTRGLWPLSEVRMPDKFMFWILPAIMLGIKLLRKHDFCLIYSSSGPASSTIVASVLQRYSHLPWIAEFRDLWSDNHVDKRCRPIHTIDSFLEDRCLKNCAGIVTVSEPLRERLLNRHGKDTYVIYNGYDEEDCPKTVKLNPKLTITYTGRIYAGKQDPTPLFKAISKLSNTGKVSTDSVQMRFYGKDPAGVVRGLSVKYGIEDYVHFGGIVPHEESLLKQSESWVLLLLEWNDPASKGILTGKLFEYLGARRPILCIGYNDGAIAKILQETGVGVILNKPGDIEKFLASCIDLHAKKDTLLGFRMNGNSISKYSRKEAAKKLSQIFSSLEKGRTSCASK